MPKHPSPWDAITRVVRGLTPAEREAFRAVALRPISAIRFVQAKAKRQEGLSAVEVEAFWREITETGEPFVRWLAKHGIDLVPTTQKPTRRRRTARRKPQ